MMKHTVSLILTACLCLSLAGCFQKPISTEKDAPVLTAPTETKEPAAESTGAAGTEPTAHQTLPTEEQPSQPEPAEDAFVPVDAYSSGMYTDLKYASPDNFTGRIIYDFQDVYLRYGTVKKLMQVQAELETMGMALKIWDAFRPVSAQFALWEVCPDPTYVANPETGHSSHSLGNTVDVTLVNAAGEELEMPTGFDDFTPLADRDYSDCGETAAQNARLLQEIMEKHGFKGYFGEWWHFSDQDSYPVEEVFQPAVRSWWYADCQEFISLRTEPDTGAEVITRIPVKEEFRLLGWHDAFALVDYRGLRGYVLAGYMQPVQESAA